MQLPRRARTVSTATPPTRAAISACSGKSSSPAARSTSPPTRRCRRTNGCCSAALAVRGFGTGAFDGDRTLVDLRGAARADHVGAQRRQARSQRCSWTPARSGTSGRRTDDVEWHRGVGGGVFLIASIVRINLDIAHGLKTGDTRSSCRRGSRSSRGSAARGSGARDSRLRIRDCPNSRVRAPESRLYPPISSRRTRRWRDVRRAGACTTGTSTRRS